MSKDKYPSIFSPQMEAIVFIILQIFFTTPAVLRSFENWEIFNNDPAKSRGISSDTKATRPKAESAKIRRYSARLSRIIVLLFNKLITKEPKSL